jgi:hypothetical protein
MFEAIGSWLVQLFYGWRIEAIHWLPIYGVFVLVCCIIALIGCIVAAIMFGLHLLWRSFWTLAHINSRNSGVDGVGSAG